MKPDQTAEVYVSCPLGLEEALARECAAIGVERLRLDKAGVFCEADFGLAMRLCLWSRVASRVLWPLSSGWVANRDQLYSAVKAIPWEEWFEVHQTFAVSSNCREVQFTNANFATLVAKDAIADRFRERCDGLRPSVNRDNPEVLVDLHLNGKRLDLSLDLGGESLHRRGWRVDGGLSPLKENLAAGILVLAGWVPGAPGPLLDPMCGSGTFLVEAGLILCDTAPGLLRPRFCFMNLKPFVAPAWEALLEEARTRDQRQTRTGVVLFGRDLDLAMVGRSLSNLEAAGLAHLAQVEACELTDCEPPPGPPGTLVTNPPYGQRMLPDTDLLPLYKSFGDLLKKRFEGWDAWVITTQGPLSKSVGLKTSARIPLFNGAMECRLLKFQMYQGSKKASVPQNG
jgi:23S rRNA (guanine2445-N2)-methyltransferase / 23S rRNA (guanine2069-N7)-methyltransferase